MKRRRFVTASLLATPGLFGVRWRAVREPRLVERWSWAMGQPVHLRLFHPSEAGGLEAAQAALAELRRVEAILSRFDAESELSQLQRLAGRGWHRASQDLRMVLEAAAACRRSTGGAFDIAVEPLMRAWGFREPRKALPGSRELAEALAALRSAVVQQDGDRFRLPAAHTRLDLGGIGVGYGLDRAGAVLRSHGVSDALVEVSGDVLALGAPPGQPGWLVDIVDPRTPGATLATTQLSGAALATSGQTVSVVEVAGRRIAHVMDPSVGRPAAPLLQATVVARTGLAADALSTATLVAGRQLPGTQRSWII